MGKKYRRGQLIVQILLLLHIWFLNSLAMLTRQLPWWRHWYINFRKLESSLAIILFSVTRILQFVCSI